MRPPFSSKLVPGLTFPGLGWCLGTADCQCILGWCRDPGGWRRGTLRVAGSTSGKVGGAHLGKVEVEVISWCPYGCTELSLVVYPMIHRVFYVWWCRRCFINGRGVSEGSLQAWCILVVSQISASKNSNRRYSKYLLEWWLPRRIGWCLRFRK